MPPSSSSHIHVLVKLPFDPQLMAVDHEKGEFKAYSRNGEQLKDAPEVNALVGVIKRPFDRCMKSNIYRMLDVTVDEFSCYSNLLSFTLIRVMMA